MSTLVVALSLLTIRPVLFHVFANFLSTFLAMEQRRASERAKLYRLVEGATLGVKFFRSTGIEMLLDGDDRPLFRSNIINMSVYLILTLVGRGSYFFLGLHRSHRDDPPCNFSARTTYDGDDSAAFRRPRRST